MLRFILFSIGMAAFSSTGATLTDGRANVMECSHDEVVAYMALPDAERQALMNYKAWEKAYQSTEIKRSEDDPAACIGLLYGDLQDMADRVKSATEGLMSLSTASLGDAMKGLGDKLMEGICGRIEAADTRFRDQVLIDVQRMELAARQDLTLRYGQKALQKHVDDAVSPPEYRNSGSKYRNNQIDRDAFRNSIKQKWTLELAELATSGALGN